MANSLVLDTTSIREQDGLYSLNDLHRASGAEPSKRPSFFLNIQQAQELVAEISNSNAGIPAFRTQRGANGGTYACRELVIAYAAWISAAFHLKVIRVFLAQTSQPTAHITSHSVHGQRLLVTFLPNGQMDSQALKADECVVSPNNLSSMLTLISDYVPTHILLEVVRRSFERLSNSVQQHR